MQKRLRSQFQSTRCARKMPRRKHLRERRLLLLRQMTRLAPAFLLVSILFAPQARAQTLRLVRPVEGCNFQNLGQLGSTRSIRLVEGRTTRILDTTTGKSTSL